MKISSDWSRSWNIEASERDTEIMAEMKEREILGTVGMKRGRMLMLCILGGREGVGCFLHSVIHLMN
jgi:hypothetical protein